MNLVRTALIAAISTSALAAHTAAQTPAASTPVTAVALAAGDQRPAPVVVPAPPRPGGAQPIRTHRWFDLQVGQVDMRYRLIESSAGVRSSNTLQHKQTIRAAFKFDPTGRYTLQTGLGTGSQFVSTWEGTGLGTSPASWGFAVRTLYAAAQPVKGVEFQLGGLAPIRGESTEITAYDNDAYLVGERVSLKRPATLYLDEVSVTAGYLGDLTTPNVFARLDRLNEHNYTQVLAAKKLGSRAAASMDWTRATGSDTWREAVRLSTKEARLVDAVRLELYQRVDTPTGQGFAVIADKALSKRVSLSGGYASVDRNNGVLNGDRYARGNRIVVEGRVDLTPELTLSSFYGHAVANDFAVLNKTRFDIVVSYNVLKALQRAGAL